MHFHRSYLLVLPLLLLSACSTTVVTEEERELPPVPTAEEEPAERVPATILTADQSQSFIAFTGSKGELVSHEGKFESYTFQMNLDESDTSDFTKGKIFITIEIGSMTTDSEKLTDHLLNDDFFGAETYPRARFTSTSIASKEGDMYTITGDLTIKDVTESVTFDAEITSAYLTMTYDLDRTAFGVGAPPEGLQSVDANVPIEAKIVFRS